MRLNLDNFTIWNKSVIKKNENTDYVAYMNKRKDRVVIFDNAASLVQCFKNNFSQFGGNGSWVNTNSIVSDPNKVKLWTFGEDFPTYNLTAEALEKGVVTQKYLDLVEQAKDELFKRFPELHSLSDIAISKKRRRVFREDGDELCIDRYMSNDPAMFSSMPRHDVKTKSVNVYCDISVNGGTSPEDTTKSMVFLFALCDIIESSGITVGIAVGSSADGRAGDARISSAAIIAKQNDEPFDIAKLLSLCLPGINRQFFWSVSTNVTNDKSASISGNAVTNLDAYPELFDIFNADIMVKAGNFHVDNGAIKVIIDKIKSMFNMNAAA